LNFLKTKVGNLRGRELMHDVYLDYPSFTSRSKIVGELFSAPELAQIKCFWNSDKTTSLLFTIGYEGLTTDSFLNQLIMNNAVALVDVRNNPQSMKYGFSKRTLQGYIESAGMKYFHVPELGRP
jgi:hypothetical protein